MPLLRNVFTAWVDRQEIKRLLSGDTNVDDLGDISRPLNCFTSNFS